MNLQGQLLIIRGLNMKPNFSELARTYKIDRRTIKKYWSGYQGKPKTKSKASKLDEYQKEIAQKLSISGINIKAAYEFMNHKYPDIGTYSNFSKYVKKNKLFVKVKKIGHPRYETDMGVQAQVDWKEDVKMISRHGEVFVVNILSFVLGYSRWHYFEYSKTKEQADVFRCLYNAFRSINGVPKEILFDNMATAAVNHGRNKRVNPNMARFAKECGFQPRLCKVRHSYTKGKVEASNKFLTWLLAYNHEFENEEDLVEIIRRINHKTNLDVCQGTHIPPHLLFQKEKEYLLPLPHHTVVEHFIEAKRYKVHKDGLVYYKGKKYSVDPKLIDETVTITEFDNKLYIYYKLVLSTIHQISENNVTYKKEHYTQLMASSHQFQDDKALDQMVIENLARLDSLL